MANQTTTSAYRFSSIGTTNNNNKFAAICPVSDKKIDENIARLVAAQTVVLLLITAYLFRASVNLFYNIV